MKNQVSQILTLYNEAYIRGEIDIKYNFDIGTFKSVLERELQMLGFSSMRNKLQSYLKQKEAELQETLIDSGVSILTEYCENSRNVITQNDDNIEKEDLEETIRRFVLDGIYTEAEKLVEEELFNTLDQDPESKKKIYTYSPEIWETDNREFKIVVDRVIQGVVEKDTGNVQQKENNDKRRQDNLRRQAERVLVNPVSTGGKKKRQEKICIAYLMGMNVAVANEFLKKGWMTYGFDFNNDYDLYAAYLIQHEPFILHGDVKIFWEKMRVGIPKKDFEKVESFRKEIQAEQNLLWKKEYDYWERRGQGERFIRVWAWKYLIHKVPSYGTESVFIKKEKTIKKEYYKYYQALKDYAEGNSELCKDDEFINCLREQVTDRKNRILDFIHFCNNNRLKAIKIQDEEGNPQFDYVPFFRLDKISEIDFSENLKRDNITRNILITTIIDLGLTWDAANYFLNIAGFYQIYVCNIFEFSLAKALYEMERRYGSDGIRLKSMDGFVSVLGQCIQEQEGRIGRKKNRKVLKNKKPKWVQWIL